jgi:L-lactate utilization protein LutC
MMVYSHIARRPRLFTLAQKLAALGIWIASPVNGYVRLPAFTGWGYSKDLPRFAGRTFRERFVESPLEDKGMQRGRYTGTQEPVGETKTEQPPLDKDARISKFMEELRKVNGNVICLAPHELKPNVIKFLKTRGINQIHLEPYVLDENLLQDAGISVQHTPGPETRVGLTKAICGLADTGSILIADGEGNPLQASLLPEIHIAVLNVSDILPSMADAMMLPIVRQSKAAVFITGPSRTADIEMSLTIGMHGPREVQVFLVDG